MHIVFRIAIFVVGLSLFSVASLHAQTAAFPRQEKKLIEYGWDVPYPDQIRKNIKSMEQKPFDGVIFRLREWNHAFDPRPWDEAQLKPQLDDLAAIEWKTFTDNFLCLYAANNWKMDWFNDEQWQGITANLRLSAKAARIGRCVGIVFDPEPYGDNPWAYAGKNKDHSFGDLEIQVRKRGAQFISAIQAEMPNARVLTFFHQSLFSDVTGLPDANERQRALSQKDWALLSAFWNGALEAAAPGVRIIDGYELAYYFTSSRNFLDAYHRIKQRSLTLVPTDLRAKYAVSVQAGMALYVDQNFGLREPTNQYVSTFLTPSERQQWFEYNVYWAMETSDEYVWCYSERMNWWEDKIPEGLDAAVRSARTKIANGRACGIEVGDLLAAGQKKMQEAAKANPPAAK